MTNIKVITLGTSHGDPTYCRFNSATILQVGEDLYLIDVGGSANALMVRHGLVIQDLQSIFVTHTHEDHIGGITGVIKSITKHAKKDQFLQVFIPESQAISALKSWIACMHRTPPEDLISYQLVESGLICSDSNMQVRALPTRHLYDETEQQITYAYQFDIEKCRVIFTGDLRDDFSDFPQIALDEESEVVICECTHFKMEDAVKTLKHCKTKKVIFNHVPDMYHGEGEQLLRDIISELPFPCEIAHDGEVFEIRS